MAGSTLANFQSRGSPVRILLWFRVMHAAGHASITRNHTLLKIRAYLYWVGERLPLQTPSDELGAGMSLVGVMHVLGHRDHRVTLRYAAITPETIGDEDLSGIRPRRSN